ncbi:uncharacterized protein CELE_F22F7.8 [Caenorhabditis elegans]|uniref:Uncharacterized protein n=1 Tax=Caenorhabditis elegans TaxID=6239 RepID=D1YSH7_CAEEL|nr:Uncharacterized protein CELE_F22F7.8 [Caenorhabditis elegans]CCD67447.1 Uncharacterized protein CELE_F22F7.8 [Caenorhabditis elegans]|eukprot:NP_001256010.1 Uncharacterized protein CELE_F22F7.8 [Caenorhabditis elegans]
MKSHLPQGLQRCFIQTFSKKKTSIIRCKTPYDSTSHLYTSKAYRTS